MTTVAHLDEHLASDQLLGSAKFPTARFVSTKVTVSGTEPTIGFQATTTIKRSDYGVTFLTQMVSDSVPLTINAAFEAQ